MKPVLLLFASFVTVAFATTLTRKLSGKVKRSGRTEESQSLSKDLQDYIVTKHNELRSDVSPPATNMKTMVSDRDSNLKISSSCSAIRQKLFKTSRIYI